MDSKALLQRVHGYPRAFVVEFCSAHPFWTNEVYTDCCFKVIIIDGTNFPNGGKRVPGADLLKKILNDYWWLLKWLRTWMKFRPEDFRRTWFCSSLQEPCKYTTLTILNANYPTHRLEAIYFKIFWRLERISPSFRFHLTIQLNTVNL